MGEPRGRPIVKVLATSAAVLLVLLATGCGTSEPVTSDSGQSSSTATTPYVANGSSRPAPRTSPVDGSRPPTPTKAPPATWIELVNAAGRLNTLKYGSASLTFATGGGAVSIVVGVGTAPAWHVDIPQFHCELYPSTDAPVPPDKVPLRRLVVKRTADYIKYDFLTPYDLKPGKYNLQYWGQGWYGLSINLTRLP